MNNPLELDTGAILDPNENPGAVASVVINLSKRIASIQKHLANHPNDCHAKKNLAALKQRQSIAIRGLWKRDFSQCKEVYIHLQKNEKENEK
ncbi:MAG: hypothetical protein ACOX4A_02210 [Saccharofermentanales bacterium]|jgi:ribosomal protein S15P/S13E